MKGKGDAADAVFTFYSDEQLQSEGENDGEEKQYIIQDADQLEILARNIYPTASSTFKISLQL